MTQARKWLKDMRDRKGLSAPALATLLQVSHRSVYRWESGEERPSRRNITRLTDVLGPRVLTEFQAEERRMIASVRAGSSETLPAASGGAA